MFTLAAGDTLRAIADAASQLTCTVCGLEVSAGNRETYKILDQRQLPTSTTTIYTAPNPADIRTISVVNNDTASHTAQFFINGTSINSNAITPVTTIEPGFCWKYEDGRGWRMFSTRNEIQSLYQAAYRLPCFGPTGALAETYDRNWVAEVNVAALSTGRLTLQAIWLTAGMVLSSITFASATTALATGTNQRFSLYDVNRMLLAQTSDDTSTAWAANTTKTLNLTSRYTVPYTGLYYLGIMVAATTVPTLKGHTAFTASQIHGLTPVINGTSSTGLTTALANPAAAVTVGTTSVWGAVS
jgi:hypothetical protein